MLEISKYVSARATGFTSARALSYLAAAVLLSSCSSMAYRSRIEEFRNPAVPSARFTAITVLPANPEGFDPGIAARVRENLKRQGVTVLTARVMVEESEVAMTQLCPRDDPPAYKGVLWVSYDRVILRDCESAAVAYRAMGGYSGVDALAQKLVLYLKEAAPTTTTAQ